MKRFKLLSLVLCLVFLFNVSIIPAKAFERISFDSNTSNFNSSIVNLGVLPENGDPLVFVLPISGNGLTKASEYIVFTITRDSVKWQCVNVPSDQVFSGSMNISDVTSGYPCASLAPMNGKDGAVTYIGFPGHQYLMNFSGWMWTTDSQGNYKDKLTQEAAGYTWVVPIKQ